MEEFLSFVPLLVIIISIVSKFMDNKDKNKGDKGFSKFWGEVKEGVEKEPIMDLFTDQRVEINEDLNKELDLLSPEDLEPEVDLVENQQMKEEQLINQDSENNLDLDRNKLVKQKKRPLTNNSRNINQGIFNKGLTEKGIIYGVIFKEIFDKPKAKRPYHPRYW